MILSIHKFIVICTEIIYEFVGVNTSTPIYTGMLNKEVSYWPSARVAAILVGYFGRSSCGHNTFAVAYQASSTYWYFKELFDHQYCGYLQSLLT